MIDLHSHILPGIDDGAADISDSLDLIRELSAGGVTEVFATPHYIDETIYNSPRYKNSKLVADLQKRLDAEEIPVKIHLGNEIYINRKILELLKAGEISSMGDSKYILVELPMSGEFPGYADIFLELIRAGYKVILAHPERYTSFQNDFSLITELYNMGVLLQCNIGSFVDQYGKVARKVAVKLAKEKMIFGMGTDIHHLRGEEFLPGAMKKLSKYYNSEELNELLVGNPRKVFQNIV
ncbi:hypothetical protein IKF84_01035 [Candidatus Saccharibacteria bacterium]|nr:hypothetical protein [Candidatus Saccharibacteria bacterium]